VYFSLKQIQQSIERLDELNPFFGTVFLAFKEIDLPAGNTKVVQFTPLIEAFLQRYYRLSPDYSGFYTPFKTSNTKQRWNSYQYASSLHRITVDTFSDVILHPKNSQIWGWQNNYVNILAKEHLSNQKIPTFDLAVWLYRTRDWSEDTTRDEIISTFLKEFHIHQEELPLFNLATDFNDTTLYSFFVLDQPDDSSLFQDQPVSTDELLSIIGNPPKERKRKQSPRWNASNTFAEYGARLQRLRLSEIGPADDFELDLAPRLNVITGDNALGKTFLLECAWWALTNTWASKYPAYPRPTAEEPTITFQIGKEYQEHKIQTVAYNWRLQSWSESKKRDVLPGLSIFAQVDGSFSVWDPVKRNSRTGNSDPFLRIMPDEVWEGVRETRNNKEVVRCRGLIEDWVTWQTSNDEELMALFNNFSEILEALSLHPQHPLIPGRPTRIPDEELDVRQVPTLQFPYGSVPIILCSAGIKRIVSLAYILVWAWHEHVIHSALIREQPQRSIVLLIDEMEAHLHPFWQRAIVPAVIKVVQALSKDVSTQVILATHSPLVLASMEPIFDEDQDKLFHLYMDFDDGSVQLNEMSFVKRGCVDRWLTSDIFGLAQPRSQEAEEAISQANELQLSGTAQKQTIQDMSDTLKRVLAPDDDFWPRWTYLVGPH
jgi:hypothetical protein